MILNSPTISGSLTVTGNILTSGSITLSGSIASASYAATASFVALAQSASNAVAAVTASFANAFTVAGNLTAQTLVVQTITSSVDFVTGSTRFGSLLANTHVFSGSVSMNPGGLFVSSSGVVGIGTTSPSSKLEVNVGLNSLKISGRDTYVDSTEDPTNANIYVTQAGVGDFGQLAGNLVLQARTQGTVYRDIIFAGGLSNGDALMTILGEGNVGIGTINPQMPLSVQANTGNGAIRLIGTSNASSNNAGIYWYDSNDSTFNGYLGNFSTSFDIYNQRSTPMVFYTNGSEKMRLTAGGRLAIGRTTPGTSLSVAGQSEVWQLALSYDTGEGGVIGSPSANVIAFGNWAGTERMRISSSGELLIGTTSSPSAYGLVAIRGTNKGLTIQDAVSNGYRSLYFQSGNLYFYNGTNEGYLSSGGTWVNASDVTLKKDVKEIEYGLKEVMELKPKWYRMIEDDLEQIGFIAQDVEEVLPELVSTSEKGMKGLSYGQLTAVLVKAIQEQQAQIEAQQQTINSLINR